MVSLLQATISSAARGGAQALYISFLSPVLKRFFNHFSIQLTRLPELCSNQLANGELLMHDLYTAAATP